MTLRLSALRVLDILAPEIQEKPELLKQAIQTVIKIDNQLDKSACVYALLGISNYALKQEERLYFLEEAKEIINKDFFLDSDGFYLDMVDMLIKLNTLDESDLNLTQKYTQNQWTDMLENASLNRANLLTIIPNLAEIALHLSDNPNEAKEIARAVMDVGEWWP